jgi:hypothetical protein
MLKAVAVAGMLTTLFFAAARLRAQPAAVADLRPLLTITASQTSTDSPDFFTAERFTIYQGGTLQYQAMRRAIPSCVDTTLALGTGSAGDQRILKRALRTGQVGIQRDCGLGQGFGINLEYQLEWRTPDGRVNRFEFGSFYQSGCPAGVAVIKDAIDAYVRAVFNARGTKIVRSAPCPP